MTSIDIIRLDRHLGLGASDAKRILEGDWHELYLEKIQEKEPEDLTHVFRVQLGIFTEPFHLDWLAKTHGFNLVETFERIHHPVHDFMFCHLDGWRDDHDTFIEVKHSNGRATAREKAIYYMPQLQHQLAVTDKHYCYFSVIAGNEDPQMVRVDRNGEYITKLIELEQSFWWHVENRVAPEITPKGKQAEVARIGATVPIDGLRSYDMTGNNQWADAAASYLECQAAAARFDNAKSSLKSLVPADAAECSGYGITIKRDKRGSLRFNQE